MAHAFAVIVLLALFFFLTAHTVSHEPFLYDEADYMYAASLGVWANYTDTPTLPLADFLRIGLGRGRESGERQALSELIRGGNDVLFYRHWHGPLYYYFLIPVSRMGLDEHGVRMAMLAIPAASLIVMYLGCIWLIPGARGIVAGALSSVLFLASHAVVWSTELAPHQLFVLCFLSCLFLLAKTIATGRPMYWYLAVVMAGLAFCTLEIAFVLIATLVMCGYVERRRLETGWGFAGRSLVLLIATVLAVWPGAILKLSFLKAYFFMAYLALSRNAAWDNVGFLETWRQHFLDSPLESMVIVVSLILYFRARQHERLAYPILVYAFLMLALLLRVWSITTRYSLPYTPAFDLFAGIALAGVVAALRKPAGLPLALLVSVSLYAITGYQVLTRHSQPSPRPRAVLSFVRENQLTDKALLVPQDDLPLLHYYFRTARLRGYYDQAPNPSEVTGFTPDAILYPGNPLRFEMTR